MVKSILYFIFYFRTVLLLLVGLTCAVIGIIFAIDKHPAWLLLSILGLGGCGVIDFTFEDKDSFI